MNKVLGIDIGGTGMKGGIVDVDAGKLLTERKKFLTPHPATPEAVIEVVKDLIEYFDWKEGKIGVGFPAIIKNGKSMSASNVDQKWLDYPIYDLFEKTLNRKVVIHNDADVAGIAEVYHGAGKGKTGVILMLTIGTGIGSALFVDGKLVPNTELGHLKFKDKVAEKYASNKYREDNNLSWKEWGRSLKKVLQHIEFVINPDLIILGGGVSKKFEKYKEYLDIPTPIVPALLKNEAGVIGAAISANI